MSNANYLRGITYALIIIGALNWGLMGLFDFNLVSVIFDGGGVITRIIYALVGLSALIHMYIVRSESEKIERKTTTI